MKINKVCMFLMSSQMLLMQVKMMELPVCEEGVVMNKCYQELCNPEWYNWIRGCTLELKERVPKKDNIYSFMPLKDNGEGLKYIDIVIDKTYDMALWVYQQAFLPKSQWSHDQIDDDDVILNLDVILKLIKFDDTSLQIINQIRTKLEQKKLNDKINEKVQEHLIMIQQYLIQSITKFQNIYEQFESIPILRSDNMKQQVEKTLHQEYPLYEQIEIQFTLIDSYLNSIQPLFGQISSEKVQSHHEFYTFQLLYHCAIFHINVKTALAIVSRDQDAVLQILQDTKEVYQNYQKLIISFSQKAYDWRMNFITNVTCKQYEDQNCIYKQCEFIYYEWSDHFYNITVNDKAWIFLEDNIFNLCFIYGQKINGTELVQEQAEYKNAIGKFIMDYYDKYKILFTKIPKSFVK